MKNFPLAEVKEAPGILTRLEELYRRYAKV